MAWDSVLSGWDTNSLLELFSNNEPYEKRQFSLLHLIVLGLTEVPRDLGLELQQSTSNINARDTQGRTALSWAAERQDLDAVDTLLAFGADPEITDSLGLTALHYACIGSYSDALCLQLLLLSGANSTRKDQYGRTPLHLGPSRPSVEILVQYGANVNARELQQQTPIFLNCHNEHSECALALIESGADIEARDYRGNTPILRAIYNSANDVVSLLLSHDVSYHVRNYGNHTVLHFIALAPSINISIVQMLTALDWQGVDVNAVDAWGWTARDYYRIPRETSLARTLRCLRGPIQQGRG